MSIGGRDGIYHERHRDRADETLVVVVIFEICFFLFLFLFFLMHREKASYFIDTTLKNRHESSECIIVILRRILQVFFYGKDVATEVLAKLAFEVRRKPFLGRGFWHLHDHQTVSLDVCSLCLSQKEI